MGLLEVGAARAACLSNHSYNADLGEGVLSKNSTGHPPRVARAGRSGRGGGGASSATDTLSLGSLCHQLRKSMV